MFSNCVLTRTHVQTITNNARLNVYYTIRTLPRSTSAQLHMQTSKLRCLALHCTALHPDSLGKIRQGSNNIAPACKA